MYSQKWFGGKEQTHPCWNSGQFYRLHIFRKDLLTSFLYFSQACFWKGICIPFIHISITKKAVTFILEDRTAKFLFLPLNCLLEDQKVAAMSLLHCRAVEAGDVQPCVMLGRGPRAACWAAAASVGWRCSEATQLLRPSVYLPIGSSSCKASVAVILK